jgi:omega-6 fatty acid desaturase (delta-12 desaturase)
LLLATKKYASDSTWLSWWHVGSTLASLAILLAIACLDFPLIARIAASVVAGFVMTRLFVLYHDYQHRAILPNSRVASLIMYVYGILAINPPSIWNRSHNHHHKNNSKAFGASIGSYPIMTTDAYARATAWERCRYVMARHPATIAFGYVSIFLYGMCLRSMLTNPRRHFDSGIALSLHLSLLTVLAFVAWDIMLLGVILPFGIASAFGAYLFYAQHNFPEARIRDREKWNYVDAALNSSSYMKMGRLMCWFTANIGYHHIHHLNARIPFYRLPEAMAELEELQSPRTTSLNPLEIYRCLRLKLWDQNRDRLVTFREATEDIIPFERPTIQPREATANLDASQPRAA